MSDFLDSMSDADLRNEFRALLNRVTALEQRPVQVDSVDQIAVDLGEFSAFLLKIMDGDKLRMLFGGEDLFDLIGVHAHIAGLDDNEIPQAWFNALEGSFDFAGGAGKLNRLGILMSGLKFIIQQTASNLSGENQRVGWLSMFLPDGGTVPVWGLTRSLTASSPLLNGSAESGDLTNWTESTEGSFSVVPEGSDYCFHANEVLTGSEDLLSDRFPVTGGVIYTGSIRTNEYEFGSQNVEISASQNAPLSGISAEYNLNMGGYNAIRVGKATDGVSRINRTLTKWDLSAYTKNCVVTAARLRLYNTAKYGSNNCTLNAYNMLKDWVEGTGADPADGATWNTYDGETAWQTAGAAGSTDRSSTSMGSVAIPGSTATGTWHEFDVEIATIQAWLNTPASNYGVLFKSSLESSDARYFNFNSSSYSDSAKATLKLTYTRTYDYDVYVAFFTGSTGSPTSYVKLLSEQNQAGWSTRQYQFVVPSWATYASIKVVNYASPFKFDSIALMASQSLYFDDEGVTSTAQFKVQNDLVVEGIIKTDTSLFYNNGVNVYDGEVVLLDLSTTRAFKPDTVRGSYAVLGVAKEDITNGTWGHLATIPGEIVRVKCDDVAVAIGDYLITSALLRGVATSNGKVRTANCFAKALSSKGTTYGYVYCMILDHNPVVATPAEISNLSLWLRPESLSAYGEGAACGQWDDESGLANHATQSTAAYRPLVRKNALNGYDILDFDGSNDGMATVTSVFSGTAPRTMIAVCINDNPGSGLGIGQRHTGSAGQAFQFSDTTGANGIFINLNTSVVASGLMPNNNPRILCGTHDSLVSKLFIEGVLRGTFSGTINTTNTGFKLGYTYNGSAYTYYDIKVAEVICYSRELTDDERGAVHEYLSNKYGITLS